mmetsp:Transcript_142564/g.262956  ORF Transcript_142564/g.262956 Transcript_142564/m.262956 type:complete len:117 (-) Transcript_142564:22-372(-)
MRRVLMMQAQPLRFRTAASKVQDLVVGSQTNAGKAGAAVAAALRQPSVSLAVRAMGATAIYQALTSAVLAQRYLDNDSDGVKMVVVPRFEVYGESEPSSGRGKRQLVLDMARAEAP